MKLHRHIRRHNIIKTAKIKGKERFLKAVRKKNTKISYEGTFIRQSVDFFMETLQATRACHDIFTSPLATSASPFLLCANRFINTIFRDSNICINVSYLFFSFWLTSLCLTGSTFIHKVLKGNNLKPRVLYPERLSLE